jgi:prepilin-type N-terminal cleavage/methylation domain-containing protein
MSRANSDSHRTGEQGFTLIELLVAVMILLIGIVATIGVFGTSKRTTLVAQRHELAVHIAQKEMEAMRSLKYSELGLKYTRSDANVPHHSNDPRNPNNRVRASDGYFMVNPSGSSSTCCEQMVTAESGNDPGGKVDPGGTAADPGELFTVGEGSSAVSGRIFRYVSWRDENCAALICDGSHNTKRLIVAVSLNPVGTPRIGPLNPIWETSIASDPNEGPTASTDPPPPPPPAPATSAQNFYFYDKRCADTDAQNGYTAPSASDADGDGRPDYDHVTYDTASDVALCENATATRRPNLMGPVAPTYANPPVPPFKYSGSVSNPDVNGDYPAGLAMLKTGTGCPSASYPAADATNAAVADNKWSKHAWATRKFTQPFQLSGRVFLSLWTTSVGSLAGTGRFCATLVDRKNVAGVPNDIVLGSMSREYSPWPTTKNEPGRSCGTADFPCGRQLSFSTTISPASVRADSRLILIVTVLNTSEKDLVLLYDDPRYRSLLEVETSTPCSSSGPCPTS